MTKPLCIDLFCGLGGWAEGFLAEGYDVIGFDIERRPYPGQLVLQDVRTLHGSQFAGAAMIVASPPCQAYSYRAMPWKRAKALPPPDNSLFEACWRIQSEASAAAGSYIPMVVENVKGAQKWVGRAKWHHGSYYLWGDVPAIMPYTLNTKNGHVGGGSWFAIGSPGQTSVRGNPDGHKLPGSAAVKMLVAGPGKSYGGDMGWDGCAMRTGNSHSAKRKAASALIAKIPFDLAQHIAQVFRP